MQSSRRIFSITSDDEESTNNNLITQEDEEEFARQFISKEKPKEPLVNKNLWFYL